MKLCKICNIQKDFSQFYKTKSNKDGFMTFCSSCTKEKVSQYRKNNPELIAQRKKSYYKKNSEKLNAKSKEWYEKNKDHALFLAKQWQQKNKQKRAEIQARYYKNGGKQKKYEWHEKNKEKRRLYYKEYRKNNLSSIRRNASKYQKQNPEKCLHHTRLRQALKINATPKWADVEKIKEIYKKCPNDMHVDHIIPLKNNFVCGLHVENNLQYLTVFENLSKGNKFLI